MEQQKSVYQRRKKCKGNSSCFFGTDVTSGEVTIAVDRFGDDVKVCEMEGRLSVCVCSG